MNVKNIIEVLFHSTSSPLTQKDLNHVLGDNKIKLEDIVEDTIEEPVIELSLIHISENKRPRMISYAVF